MQCLVLQPLLTYHAPATAQGAEPGSPGDSCSCPPCESTNQQPDNLDEPIDTADPDGQDAGDDTGDETDSPDDSGSGGGDTADEGGDQNDAGGTENWNDDGEAWGQTDGPDSGSSIVESNSGYSGASSGSIVVAGHEYEIRHVRLSQNKFVGNGIELGDANKRHKQVDYVSRGAAQLRVGRVYNSAAANNAARITSPMGAGWRGHYDKSAQVVSASQVNLHRSNGQILTFLLSGSSWVSTLPTGTLTQISGGWQYVNQRNQIETYDSAGKLLYLAKAGRVSTLQYDTSNRLIKVLNPYGKSLTYSYDAAGRVSVITLPDASTLQYAYGVNNNLAYVRFPDNSVRQYVYENASYPNALTGVVDEAGRRRLSWSYDSAGRPFMGTYGGNVNTQTVSYAASTATVTDIRGVQRTRIFGIVAGRKVLTGLQTAATSTTPGASWAIGYDGNGNAQSVTQSTGTVHQMTADKAARVTSATKAAGTLVALPNFTIWHAVFRKPLQTTSRGLTRNYTIDATGRTTAVTQSAGGVTSTLFTKIYNAQNLLASVTDARGATYSFTYDAAGNRTSVTNVLGNTTYFQNFNANGRAARVQRADGLVITKIFDARGRLSSFTSAGLTTSFVYDTSGRLTKKTKPDGSWLSYSYDASGSLIVLGNHRGESATLTRDTAGVVTKTSVYNSTGTLVKLATKEFNAIGKLTGVVDARGYRKQLNYLADGRLSSASDPLGRAKSFNLDSLNRMTAVNQPNTAVVTQKNTALGKPNPGVATSTTTYDPSTTSVIAIGDVNATGTGYGYDGFNRPLAESSVDGGNRSITRSTAGDVTSATDPRGITIARTLDAAGRVKTLTPPAGSLGAAVNYTYVPGRNDSLLAQMTDGAGTTAWTYDTAGRLLTKQQTIGTTVSKATLTRDPLGRVSNILYPSGMNVAITYTADVVSSIAVNGTNLINTITYRPFSNQPSSWRWGNGTTYTRNFDTDGRITSVTLGTATRSFAYDAVGRISGFTDTGAAGTKASAFTYDEADQLIGYAAPGTTRGFAYDTNGNRLSQSLNGVASSFSYYPGTNRLYAALSQTVFAYNADGSPTDTWNYALGYDAYARLVSVDADITRAGYKYNGLGQRVSKSASRANINTGIFALLDSRQFFYDDSTQLLGEYATKGAASQETVWFNGQPIATYMANVLYYINADHLSTPRSIVRASDNVEVWRWDSDPFGEFGPGLNNNTTATLITYNLRFPGQYRDIETGLHYNGMRDYDPRTGRYLQADPIGLSGGNNRYGYVGAKPLSKVDPTRLKTFSCTRPLRGSGGVSFGPIYHQYLCTSNASTGLVTCGGLGPSGSITGSPGINEPDVYSSSGCVEVNNDNACVETCIQDRLNGNLPEYNVLAGTAFSTPNQSQCQFFARDVVSSCVNKCLHNFTD
jgi:RHS repeat-associated protein